MKISLGLQLGGSVAKPNLAAPGDFSGGVEGFAGSDGGVATTAGGELVVTAAATSAFPQAGKPITGLTIGVTYVMRMFGRKGTATGDAFISPSGGVITQTASTSATLLTAEFVAGSTSTTLVVGIFGGGVTGNAIFDNLYFGRK